MIPMCKGTASRLVRSWKSSATDPTSGSRSRCRSETLPSSEIRPIILIDQLKEIYIDGKLDPIETANWFPKIYRKDYAIGLNLTGVGADDPDAQFYENYACGSQRNYTGYCSPELQKSVRAAIHGGRPGEAQAAGMGN